MTTYYINTFVESQTLSFYKIIIFDCNIEIYKAGTRKISQGDNTTIYYDTKYQSSMTNFIPHDSDFIHKLSNDGYIYNNQVTSRIYCKCSSCFNGSGWIPRIKECLYYNLDFSSLEDNIVITPYYKKIIIDKIIKHPTDYNNCTHISDYSLSGPAKTAFNYLIESLVELKQHNKHYKLLVNEKDKYKIQTIELNNKCKDMDETIKLMEQNNLIDENTTLINENNELFKNIDALNIKLEDLNNSQIKYKKEIKLLKKNKENNNSKNKLLQEQIDRLVCDINSKEINIKKINDKLNDTQILYNKLKNIIYEIIKNDKCKEVLIMLYNDYKTKNKLTNIEFDTMKYLSSIYEL